ncbi:hypothetical protein FISHEDRAFT_73109 [Fistulina hepatica ATCC 64428]|uniref:Inner membrane component domain-containing protein n=1 Tax=Fistulina hepatica ATCC 64428 TaxID=1128425 RepID=A0A0D7AGG0_9AGAR|nr:hypothetical protein FISHEDRAFT_73109 [Fistulina hepatica ATCC 64428]
MRWSSSPGTAHARSDVHYGWIPDWQWYANFGLYPQHAVWNAHILHPMLRLGALKIGSAEITLEGTSSSWSTRGFAATSPTSTPRSPPSTLQCPTPILVRRMSDRLDATPAVHRSTSTASYRTVRSANCHRYLHGTISQSEDNEDEERNAAGDAHLRHSGSHSAHGADVDNDNDDDPESAHQHSHHGRHAHHDVIFPTLIPSAQAEHLLCLENITWTLLFGWWLAAFCTTASAILYLFETPVRLFSGGPYAPASCPHYSQLLFGLAWDIVWPFGKHVEGDGGDVYSVVGNEEHDVTPTNGDLFSDAHEVEDDHRSTSSGHLQHTVRGVSAKPPNNTVTDTPQCQLQEAQDTVRGLPVMQMASEHTVLVQQLRSYGAAPSSPPLSWDLGNSTRMDSETVMFSDEENAFPIFSSSALTGSSTANTAAPNMPSTFAPSHVLHFQLLHSVQENSALKDRVSALLHENASIKDKISAQNIKISTLGDELHEAQEKLLIAEVKLEEHGSLWGALATTCTSLFETAGLPTTIDGQLGNVKYASTPQPIATIYPPLDCAMYPLVRYWNLKDFIEACDTRSGISASKSRSKVSSTGFKACLYIEDEDGNPIDVEWQQKMGQFAKKIFRSFKTRGLYATSFSALDLRRWGKSSNIMI